MARTWDVRFRSSRCQVERPGKGKHRCPRAWAMLDLGQMGSWGRAGEQSSECLPEPAAESTIRTGASVVLVWSQLYTTTQQNDTASY